MNSRNKLPAVKRREGEFLVHLDNNGRLSEKEEMAQCISDLECKIRSLETLLETNAIRETRAHQQFAYDSELHSLKTSLKYKILNFINALLAKVCQYATSFTVYVLQYQLDLHKAIADKYPLAYDKTETKKD